MLLTGELVLRQVVPPPDHWVEVDDGVATYETKDPEILVLGSSHARGFDVMRERLAARPTPVTLVQVAMEGGKLEAYSWVLRERLQPLVKAKSKLKHLLFVTEWWDDCTPRSPLINLPAKAWAFRHFFADVSEKGLTGYNRNYVRRFLDVWGADSTLVQDRGIGRIVEALKRKMRPLSAKAEAAERAQKIRAWQGMIDGGEHDPTCHDGAQTAAMLEVIEWFEARGVQVTVILWPRMPATLTAEAKKGTLLKYAVKMRGLGKKHGFRVFDYTHQTPLTEQDFLADWDHVGRSGQQKFTDLALAGHLSFLKGAAQ